MASRIYSALIRVGGVSQRVLVRADDITRARALLVAQYGPKAVVEIHSATGMDLSRLGRSC
jgi:hypothetical protein